MEGGRKGFRIENKWGWSNLFTKKRL